MFAMLLTLLTIAAVGVLAAWLAFCFTVEACEGEGEEPGDWSDLVAELATTGPRAPGAHYHGGCSPRELGGRVAYMWACHLELRSMCVPVRAPTRWVRGPPTGWEGVRKCKRCVTPSPWGGARGKSSRCHNKNDNIKFQCHWNYATFIR